MARNLALKTNVEPADSDYPYGKIKDDSGVGDGTPVNELVYGDMHQFFARMFAKSGLVYNNLPDSDYSDFQFFEAAQKLWKKFGGVNYITSTGTTYLTRNKYDLCHVINSSANNIVWLYDDTVLEDGDTVYIYNQSNYRVRINPSSANIFGDTVIYLYSSGDFVNLVYDKANTRWVYANGRITTTETLTANTNWIIPATEPVSSTSNSLKCTLINNRVHLNGWIQNTDSGVTTLCTTLASKFRPLQGKEFFIGTYANGSGKRLNIDSVTGGITITGISANTDVCLDQVSFEIY